MREITQRVETNRRVYVIAQNGLAGFEFPREKTFHALTQKLVPEGRVLFDASLYRLFKISS